VPTVTTADPAPDPARRGPGRPPRLSVDARRVVVLDAAVELFAAGGRSGTTVEAVAARAGVQKPTVYRLWPSKDELFEAAVAHEVERLAALTDELYTASAALPPFERALERAAGLVADVERRPAAYLLLVHAFHSWPETAHQRAESVRRTVVEVIERHTVADLAGAGLDLGDRATHLIATTTFTLTVMTVELILHEGWDGPDLAADLARSILACIAALAGAAAAGG